MKTKKTPAKPTSSTESTSSTATDASAAVTDPPAPVQPIEYQVEHARITPGEIDVVSNIRTEFGGPEDEELLDSVRLHGIRTALWVRRAGMNGAPNTYRYQLIAGERRYRVAKVLGLVDVPVDIYDITPEQAKALQIIENLQRKGVSEIDEGRGYKDLLDNHGYTIDTLMATVSKSKSYIYGRIKLTELPKLAIEAVQAGELTPSVAVRIARIPNPQAQLDCAKQIISSHMCYTDKAAAELIQDRFMTELKGAPFDREDPTLNPARGKCSTCTFRSGNQADLFPDGIKGRADICTNPACFKLKTEAAWAVVVKAAKAEGCEVIDPEEQVFDPYRTDELPHNSRYVRPNDKIPEEPKWTYAQVIDQCREGQGLSIRGTMVPSLHVTRSKNTGKIHKLYVRAECKEYFIKAGCKFYQAKTEAKRADTAKEIADARKLALGKIAWNANLATLIDAIVASGHIDSIVYDHICTILSDGNDGDAEDACRDTYARRMPAENWEEGLVEAWMNSLPPLEAAGVTLEIALRLMDGNLMPLADHYKVDLKAAEESRLGRLEIHRRAGEYLSVQCGRDLRKLAKDAYSADQIMHNKPIKTFEWQGLTWTTHTIGAKVTGLPTIYEVVHRCAFTGVHGEPVKYENARRVRGAIDLDGVIVHKGGIEFVLTGPELLLGWQRGECQKCGVTQIHGWTKDHAWANADRTLCTQCAPKLGAA